MTGPFKTVKINDPETNTSHQLNGDGTYNVQGISSGLDENTLIRVWRIHQGQTSEYFDCYTNSTGAWNCPAFHVNAPTSGYSVHAIAGAGSPDDLNDTITFSGY
ncbi:MAG: hypothetical protein HY040_17220 [Planctomycetes bacterium]|nr:hypothetical protein [Planctomycetota bacterium]